MDIIPETQGSFWVPSIYLGQSVPMHKESFGTVVGWFDAFLIHEYPQIVDFPPDLAGKFAGIGFVGLSKQYRVMERTYKNPMTATGQ